MRKIHPRPGRSHSSPPPHSHAGADNKWRLQFSGGAESDGHVVLELTPTEGEPCAPRPTSTRAAARIASRATSMKPCVRRLASATTSKSTTAKRCWSRSAAARRDFTVTIVENSVEGVRINQDAE